MEFAFHEDSLPAIDLKLEVDTKQLREAAKETIVFGSEQDWGDSSETWKSLEQINTTKSLKVRLLRGTTPVTDWHPVDCYKDGAWVSDQAVKK